MAVEIWNSYAGFELALSFLYLEVAYIACYKFVFDRFF